MEFSIILQRPFFLICTTVAFLSFTSLSFADTTSFQTAAIEKKLAELEATSHGRLGLFAIDTGNNATVGYRATERFPFCSTFKVIVVGAILQKSMTDPAFLEQRVMYTQADLNTGWTPITEQHLSEGMTISELCAAAICYSDNTAANLLIKQLGGLSAINAFAHSIGNKSFSLNQWEPSLNTAIPGDPHDTSTPRAMAESLEKLALDDILSPALRTQLQNWLKANTTGNTCIRAGMPLGWSVGDKTGSGDYGTRNDIAVLWPVKGAPLVLAIYFTQFQKEAPKRDDVIAAATRILMAGWKQSN